MAKRKRKGDAAPQEQPAVTPPADADSLSGTPPPSSPPDEQAPAAQDAPQEQPAAEDQGPPLTHIEVQLPYSPKHAFGPQHLPQIGKDLADEFTEVEAWECYRKHSGIIRTDHRPKFSPVPPDHPTVVKEIGKPH